MPMTSSKTSAHPTSETQMPINNLDSICIKFGVKFCRNTEAYGWASHTSKTSIPEPAQISPKPGTAPRRNPQSSPPSYYKKKRQYGTKDRGSNGILPSLTFKTQRRTGWNENRSGEKVHQYNTNWGLHLKRNRDQKKPFESLKKSSYQDPGVT
ncbi:hypothetical protein C7212DRAFT_362244 [Tuber magnatum]|uniref:Uncharacterized protein n=1 Tax=Tuber magnatum TaxID=42249 RepID=A0A317T2N7_9PEZI|nr:hypothetical protein C7212DRAFT_362244 [Tuber magnatum]